MKLLTEEEIQAHSYYMYNGALKGALAGFVISGLGFRYARTKFPKFHTYPWAMRTALFITPPTLLTSIAAEEASNKFDKIMYSNEAEQKAAIEEHKKWNAMSTSDKAVTLLNKHKYQIILATWAGSLWGSWRIINKDKLMTGPQKIVQARMYAQFITVGLLLGAMGLSMYEQKLHPDAKTLERQEKWEKILEKAKEDEENIDQNMTTRSNEDRIKSKIYRYDS
ncbi:hypothetical protein ACO0QE_003747 [Hanseniaspora vineae]